MTSEHEEVLTRLTDAKRRKIERKKAELAAELKNQDELWNAYYDGVYDAIKEIEQNALWATVKEDSE
jgi:murein tripeptide amidase MpaA